MAANFDSKKAIVKRAPYQLYMMFVDLRNFVNFLPEDKKQGIEADYDSIHATVQGFNVGMCVEERVPYSLIRYKDDGAPFTFSVELHFDAVGPADETEFQVKVTADLNFMMKTLLGSKIREALDKMVDALVAVSEGRMPEGVDPSQFPEGFNPSDLYKS